MTTFFSEDEILFIFKEQDAFLNRLKLELSVARGDSVSPVIELEEQNNQIRELLKKYVFSMKEEVQNLTDKIKDLEESVKKSRLEKKSKFVDNLSDEEALALLTKLKSRCEKS